MWSLLSDAKGFPRWNSTVTGIEGELREGERLTLHVPGTSRTFTPKVSGVVPARRMMWSNGVAGIFRGVRTLPDFGPIFEAYAKDLKREAERVADARER